MVKRASFYALWNSKKVSGSKDVKGVFTSQLKTYMNESSKNVVFGILYDESGRLYLFKSNGKNYFRLSDEFNNDNKGEFRTNFRYSRWI